MAATLFLSLLLKEYGSGSPIRIDPTDITLSTLQELPPLETTPGLWGTKFTQTSTGLPVRVQGRSMDVALQIAAALAEGPGVAAIGVFSPVYVCGGAGTVAQLGDVMAHRIGDVVFIFGQMNFTPGAGGVAETITFTLPATMQPNANFTNNGEGGGASLLTLHAATDFCTSILGVAGTKTMRFSVTTAAVTALYWRASYRINNP